MCFQSACSVESLTAMLLLHCVPWNVVQERSGCRTTSENGQADEQAAEAETDMVEAGDVGEWLGMDSSRKVMAANGHARTGVGQQHRLSRQTSSDASNKVRLEFTYICFCCFMQHCFGGSLVCFCLVHTS